jgi:TonB family protein
VYTELAPAPNPAFARQAIAFPKPALPADAPVRRAFAAPHLAALRETPAAPPPLPLTETAKIVLPEAALPILRPAVQRRPDVQVGSFPDSAVERAAPARVPEVTGAFAGARNTADKTTQNAVATGGFGEAAAFRGERQGALTTAGAGFGSAAAFRGEPQGAPTTTGAGFGNAAAAPAGRKSEAGTAGPAGFGDAVAGTAPAEPRQVRAGVFQSAVAIETPKPAGKAADQEGIASAITILDKPRPSYTEEARQLKIEGEVSLEMLFAADGKAHVLRLLKGLGHGLDESAVRSAEAIRFRPAMRGGAPLDATAVAHVTFQLAY